MEEKQVILQSLKWADFAVAKPEGKTLAFHTSMALLSVLQEQNIT